MENLAGSDSDSEPDSPLDDPTSAPDAAATPAATSAADPPQQDPTDAKTVGREDWMTKSFPKAAASAEALPLPGAKADNTKVCLLKWSLGTRHSNLCAQHSGLSIQGEQHKVQG